jgi:hypothetical protein
MYVQNKVIENVDFSKDLNIQDDTLYFLAALKKFLRYGLD